VTRSLAPPTLVVGGGFAGMAAAVRLAGAGEPVRLLEQRRRLGGRAYSFVDAATGDVLDNGQHLLTGACTGALELLRLLGTLGELRLQTALRIDYRDAAGRAFALRCPPLPAPLHLLGGLLGIGALAPAERLAALRLGRALGTDDGTLDALTVEEWLDRLRQPEATRRVVWRPLAEAILNESTHRASALPLARALAESFRGGARRSALALPVAGLSRLYEAALPAYLAARGGRVEVGARAVALLTEPAGGGDRAAGVRLADGSVLEGRRVVAAVPHHALAGLLPPAWRGQEPFASLPRLGASPIVSICLWLDRPLAGPRFLALLGTEAAWVFNRRAIASDVAGNLVTIVHSAAHRQASEPAADLVERGLEDLRRALPEARGARPLRARVIRERRATFSARPGTDRLRPGPVAPIDGLFLAGDWTATGLPAPIEGAVRSGFAAAEAALASRGGTAP
jgi:squalene-associated FAD-dependent desaturase